MNKFFYVLNVNLKQDLNSRPFATTVDDAVLYAQDLYNTSYDSGQLSNIVILEAIKVITPPIKPVATATDIVSK